MKWVPVGARLVAVVAVAVVAGACGGSDESTTAGDSSGEEFCDQIRELEESGDTDDDLAAAAEELNALIDNAPDELRGDLEVVSEAFSELSDLDEDDPESFTAIFEVFGREEVIEATDNLERYGVEECGLDPTSDAGDEGDAVSTDDDAADDAELGDGDDDRDESGEFASDDDPYDEEFWGAIDATEMSIPGLKQHLDLNYPDTGWFDTLNGYGISQDTDVEVNGPIEEEDGVALCSAILEYAAPLEPDVTITVGDNGGATFASGNVADGCSASA